MTEAEWLACDDPLILLGRHHDSATDRKLRLFAAACCRRIWQRLPDEALREAIRAAEQYVDDAISEQELRAWWRGASSVIDSTRFPSMRMDSAARAVESTARCGRFLPMMASEVCINIVRAVHDWEYTSEQQAQAGLVRDIFGGPGRSPALESAWVTYTVRQVAEAVYTDRAFDRLPILADALEDAGCTDRDILDHCRQTGEHVRGCWVVDLVLGKS